MEHVAKSGLFPPTVKRVGEVCITYSIEKRGNSYALSVSSNILSEGEAFVEDIAEDRDTAEKIKDLLVENFVSPLHILEVLDDILADGCI